MALHWLAPACTSLDLSPNHFNSIRAFMDLNVLHTYGLNLYH